MKILYLGTVCDLTEYEKMLSDCNAKPSIATIVFETALLNGLKSNGIDVDVYSYPMIPMFPRSKYLIWGNKRETLACGYECVWLKTVNVPVIKQISRRLNGRRILKHWMKQNRGQECALLSYSIPPFLSKDIVRLSRKYNVKCFAVVTDLLRDMYINSKDNKIVSLLKKRYLAQAVKHQGEFDGYVYLTDAMSEVINPEKPYIVMEGIADISGVSASETTEKSSPSAVMYAGMLEEQYGIINLMDAFEKADLGDTELWIFGNGNAEHAVSERAKRNEKIRFLGRKSRDEILVYEKKAALLVNPRNPDDEFTKYSFPSKTIEYMLSGTPVLATKLKGIPREYYDYLFLCEGNDVDLLKQGLETAFSMSAEQRIDFGNRAKRFVIEEKNDVKQTNRIVSFISGVLKS